MDTESPVIWPSWCYSGETASAEVLEHTSNQLQATKLIKRKRMEPRTNVTAPNSTSPVTITTATADYQIHNNNNNNNNSNNNNNVKSERLSPGTTDVSSRSRSVTPSSVSHPDTPPAENILPVTRNYSDFMRSLAAKYNNTNPNDFFSAARSNGFPTTLEQHFKPFSPLAIPNNNKDETATTIAAAAAATTTPATTKRPPTDYQPMINPFANSPIFSPFIDMSSTRSLLALVRTAKEAEIQKLLKNAKRQDASSPLDLSAAAPPPPPPPPPQPPMKKMKLPNCGSGSSSSNSSVVINKIPSPSSPINNKTLLMDDVTSWSVDDVCNFISGIDICAEYVQIFRDQRIDGSGLPLLTEEHLTTTMNMKLGPALKLRSILAKKLGSCSVCLHCTHCHNNSSGPSPDTNATGNSSDSCGAS